MEETGVTPQLESLVSLHAKTLYRIAARLARSANDAEDLVQETFLTAHRKLDQLRDSKAALAWLISILRSQLKEYYRKQPRTQVLTDADLEMVEPSAEIAQEWEIGPTELKQAIDQLPDDYREPLVLFYFSELRYREIAEAVDCPIGTVMSRIARAKVWLREKLTKTPSIEESKGIAISSKQIRLSGSIEN